MGSATKRHPHRTLGAEATVTVDVDGVRYTGRLVLAVDGQALSRARRSAALRVAADEQERSVCSWCAHANFMNDECHVRLEDNSLVKYINRDGRCETYRPSRRTRLARLLMCGRAPLPYPRG